MREAPASPSGSERLRTPRQVAEALGVSPSGLRRLAEIYAAVCGELPRDPRSRSRLWPPRAVRELATARRLVAGKRAASVSEALVSLRQGEADSDADGGHGTEGVVGPGGDPEGLREDLLGLQGDLACLQREIAAGRAEIARARNEIDKARSEIGEVATAVEGVHSEIAALRRQSRERPPSASSAEVIELRRRLRYLQAELEVREL